MYLLKGIPYMGFLLKRKKGLGVGLSQQEVNKASEDTLLEAEKKIIP